MSESLCNALFEKLNEKPTAFPLVVNYPDGSHCAAYGLTKREYFAAKAMQGLSVGVDAMCDDDYAESIALVAVKIADALLAALSLDKTSGGGDA